MRIIGIDYGSKRVGVALSDDEGKFAFPKEVIGRDEGVLDRIKNLAQENGVSTVILGESRDFGGRENFLMKSVNVFKEKLEKEKFTVVLEPEYSSSVEAGRFQGVGEMHDASAAAIILQRYLDKHTK